LLTATAAPMEPVVDVMCLCGACKLISVRHKELPRPSHLIGDMGRPIFDRQTRADKAREMLTIQHHNGLATLPTQLYTQLQFPINANQPLHLG
jgi:hypothetical protein